MYETKNPVFKMPSKSDVKASQKGHVVSAGAEHGETPLVSTLMHHADGATTLQTFNNANVLGGVYSVQDLPVTSTCIPVGNLALLRRFLDYPYAVAAGTWPTGLVFVPGLQHQPAECDLSHLLTSGILLELSVAHPCGRLQEKLSNTLAYYNCLSNS